MADKKEKDLARDMVGDGLHAIPKVIEPPKHYSRPVVKYILITVCVLFLAEIGRAHV